MSAAIYKSRDGWEILTSDRRLYAVWKSGNEYRFKFSGVAGEKWRSRGRLVKLPATLKPLFFQLQKNQFND